MITTFRVESGTRTSPTSVSALIEGFETRAKGEGFAVDFRVEDVQDLPFPDDSFDVVLSVLGVQFAPDQEQTASGLLRICFIGELHTRRAPIEVSRVD